MQKLGAFARRTLQEYAPDPHTLAEALGYTRDLAERIYPRVVNKLSSEPIEDFRIDFEEGFGERSDEEEDHFAQGAAEEVAPATCCRSISSSRCRKSRRSACGIIAGHQHLLHPACDLAKHMMQVALAGTGIWTSDGATNILPVGPHRASPDAPLTPAQLDENRRAVHHAWRLHAEHVRHSLVDGFYQGWDLHPAQLPTRYAAVYAFFLEGLDAASERLRNMLQRAATATLTGEIRDDDAPTGQGTLNRFERAMNCGAITEEAAVEMTGLTLPELHSKSFANILANRRRSAPQ